MILPAHKSYRNIYFDYRLLQETFVYVSYPNVQKTYGERLQFDLKVSKQQAIAIHDG